ncbi:MAG: hypothetical protein WC511_03145 [Candidatus Pacearchaeota archaeon]
MGERKKGIGKAKLLKAIQKKCLECCCGVSREVRECCIKDCPLWEYRNTTEVKKQEIVVKSLL